MVMLNWVPKLLIQLILWRFVGFASSVAGLLCYALSSSFIRLFGDWNLLKIIIYSAVSFIICSLTLSPEKWKRSRSSMVKAHVGFFVLMLASFYSFFYDKAVNGSEPDVFSLISCAAFAAMSLSLSRRIDLGVEVVLLYFFLGCLTLQLMKIKVILASIGVAFSYTLILLRSSLNSQLETGAVSISDHVAIDMNPESENPSSFVSVSDELAVNIDHANHTNHIQPLRRVTPNQSRTSEVRLSQLCFMNKLPDTVVRFSNITAEDTTPLQIALVDVRSQCVVNNGPLSSINIEICALNGEFNSNGYEDWSEREFNASILSGRRVDRPLLGGERFITLQKGVGRITDIHFADNSSWVRSRKFRLGARVVQSTSIGSSIREGTTEPFVVKDVRGESYMKHHPPYLNDEIWRLDKIAKGGIIHKRLSLHGINTVKDFLRLHNTSPFLLREKTGSISDGSWQTIIEHAKSCVIDDDKLYVYQPAEHSIGLLFNSVYVIVGVTFDGQNYCSQDTQPRYAFISCSNSLLQEYFEFSWPLLLHWQHLVEKLKQDEYQSLSDLKLGGEPLLDCKPFRGPLRLNFSIAVQDPPSDESAATHDGWQMDSIATPPENPSISMGDHELETSSMKKMA